jgi:macrolide-specific efflux system membrane fusion protein
MSVLNDLAGRVPRLSRLPRVARPARATNVLLAAAVAGLVAVGYAAVSSTASSAPAAPRTATVSRGVVLSSVSASGAVQAATNLSLGFETSGRVTQVAVKPGQKVAKGQILGRLDSTTATAAVTSAEANLATANANLAQAKAGETPQQKTADALSVSQNESQVAQAQTALKNAQAQVKIDDVATKQAVATASSTTLIDQAKKQLRADQGNLAAAVAKQKDDKAKLTVNGTTYTSADDALNATTNLVNADKARQQADQQTNFDLQTQQTIDQQQLASDPSTQKSADQAKVNADALKLSQMAKQLNADQYQLAQDETAQQTLQSLQTTLAQDATAIQGYESKIVSDNNQIATTTSQRTSQIQSAQAQRTSTLAKDRQAVSQAQEQVSSAKLAVNSTEANNAVKSTVTPAVLAQNEAAVLQSQASLTSARLALTQTVLRAPVAGTVASVGGTVGQNVSGSGTSAGTASASTSSSTGTTGGSTTSSSTSTSGSSSSFVTLVGLQGLQVTASFSESDAAKIQLAQPATVTVSAFPNKELAAHVVAIDTTGTSSSGVVTYTVTLALDRTVAGLKPGMSANANVTVGERDNVLDVPNAAVTGSGSTASVKVMKNGVQTTVPVVAGLKGDSATQILSGLTVGQEVVTSSGVAPTSLTGTTGTARPGGVGGGLGGGGLGGAAGGGFGGGGARGG